MIPKIIHYTWFSGEPFPEDIKRCIDSWHEHLHGYEFRLWDVDAIAEIDSPFLREALAEKKWAFAADYVRLYAVYNHGGIYLDTDAKLHKSLDEFLSDKCFIGKESSMHINTPVSEQYLTSHCFGAEPGNEFIGLCLRYFDGRRFIQSDDKALPLSLRLNMVLLPYIQSEMAKQYGYKPSPLIDEIQSLDTLTVYPYRYFDVTTKTPDSVCTHLALGSWRDREPRVWTYTLRDKISWRLWAVLERLAKRHDRRIIKLYK